MPSFVSLKAHGNIMYVSEQRRIVPTLARLITGFLRLDGYCLELYYWLRGPALLQVKTRGEDYIEQLLNDAIHDVNNNNYFTRMQ